MGQKHPSGYPVADDAPAFVAPALQLRRAVEAANTGAVEDAVAYTLSFPIIESQTVGFERDSQHEITIHEQGDPEPTSPDLVIHEAVGTAPDDTAVDLPVVSLGAEMTLERDPYKGAGEQTLQISERDTLRQQLLSIAQPDDANDLDDKRTSSARVILGRARAIRLRLALLDAWPEDFSRVAPADDDLDLLLHPAIVVALADGAHADPSFGPLVPTLVAETRARLPHVSRNTLREAAAAAIARVTLLGTRRAVAYLHDRFHEFPAQLRRHALEIGSRFAVGQSPVIANQMLHDALR